MLDNDPDLHAEPVVSGPLAGRITRIKGSAEALRRSAGLASTLRRQGVPISANYVTPMGGQWKSVAGPEPTAGARRRVSPGPARESRGCVSSYSTPVCGLAGGPTGSKAWNARTIENSRPGRPRNAILHTGAGHGSFCAGLVQQVAPDAEVVVERVLDIDGVQDEVGVAEAMVRAVETGLADQKDVVLSLSLGTETADDERPVAFGVAFERIEELRRDPKARQGQA